MPPSSSTASTQRMTQVFSIPVTHPFKTSGWGVQEARPFLQPLQQLERHAAPAQEVDRMSISSLGGSCPASYGDSSFARLKDCFLSAIDSGDFRTEDLFRHSDTLAASCKSPDISPPGSKSR